MTLSRMKSMKVYHSLISPEGEAIERFVLQSQDQSSHDLGGSNQPSSISEKEEHAITLHSFCLFWGLRHFFLSGHCCGERLFMALQILYKWTTETMHWYSVKGTFREWRGRG